MPWYFLLLVFASFTSLGASKLDIGGGIVSAQIPHYLGSDQNEQYVMPVPYIRYQSDQLDVDRNSFTGYLWHKEKWHLELSAGISLAVDSKDNKTRHGMDDLDWVFELGPSLNYYLLGEPKALKLLYVGVFTRKATATDFGSVKDAGWRLGPSLYFETPLWHTSTIELTTSLRANVNFSDARYLNYYYGVSGKDSLATRTEFSNDSGFSSADLSIGLSLDSKQYWLGGFVKYHYLAGSKQLSSPLVKQDNNVSFGVGFAWKFYTKQWP